MQEHIPIKNTASDDVAPITANIPSSTSSVSTGDSSEPSKNGTSTINPVPVPVRLKKTQSKDFKDLARAIMNGNKNKFELLLKKVIKVNELNSITDIPGKLPEDGNFKDVSLAYLAACYQPNQHFFLITLLENGANPSYKNPINNHSLLHFAAQSGWDDILTLLLEKNAEINVLDVEGRTPVFMAAKNGHVNCVKKLCNKGADLLLVDNKANLYTPLIIAIVVGNITIVMTIIVIMKIRGIKKYHDEIMRASRACAEFSQPKILSFITSTIEKEWPNKPAPQHDHNALLYSAAEKGMLPLLISSIQQGADVNVFSDSHAGIKFSPLFIASQNGLEMIVKILLQRGADPLLGTSLGEMPVLAALWNKRLSVVEVLYSDPRLNINKPLSISLNHPRFQSPENALILSDVRLIYRSPVSATLELTPLHLAVVFIKDNLDVITKLFELGATANIHCNDRSILKIAIFTHASEAVLKLLLKQGAKPSESDFNLNHLILIAIASLNIVAVKVLCEELFKLEKNNGLLNNILLSSYCFKNKEAASYLISLGADCSISCPDSTQQSIGDWLGIRQVPLITPLDEPISLKNIHNSTDATEPVSSLPSPSPKTADIDRVSSAPVNSFTNEPQMSMGSRKYLRDELKIPDTEIDAMIALNKKNKKEQPRSQGLMFQAATPAAVIHFTWCKGEISSKNLIKIEGNSAPNCFYLFPEDVFLEEQGCTAELAKKFKSVRPVFDAAHLKKLDDNISEFTKEFYFNNIHCFLTATHELKISDTDRLLVFPLPADNNQEAKLFLPLVFVPHGFHSRADIKSQSASTKAYRISVSEGQMNGEKEMPVRDLCLFNK